MRGLLTTAAMLTFGAFAAHADDTETSGVIATQGLGAATARLEGMAPSADRDLALSAARFLAGIETAYQARWRVGATDPLVPLPILQAMLPANPDPHIMQPDDLNRILRDLNGAMQSTRETLSDADGALVLDLRDLWLDVDDDGQRESQEDLLDMIDLILPDGPLLIRFDRADVHWLRAYTHMIEGIDNTILAFDPAPAIKDMFALRDVLKDQFAEPPGQMARDPRFQVQAQFFGPWIDRGAVAIRTLRHQPDAPLILAARDNLRAMIAANRDFWKVVAQESDNDREWIPNDGQQAALGFEMPEGTGTRWLAVLSDMDQVLAGKMLVPFWRFAPGYGVDLAGWMKDPRPVDLVDWIQGVAAVPHARPGLTVSRDNLDSFMSMFAGNAGLYMLLLN